MNKKQDYLYWREWQATWKAILKTNPLAVADPERHRLHVQALGQNKSHKDFTNADFDKVLGAFRALSKPDNVNAQLRQLKQTQTRLLHAIELELLPRLTMLLHLQIYHPTTPYRFLSTPFVPSREDFERADQWLSTYIKQAYKAHDLHQISYQPQKRRNDTEKSDLELVRDTLNVRINTLRGERGLTIHEMIISVGQICECAQCCKDRRSALHAAASAAVDPTTPTALRPPAQGCEATLGNCTATTNNPEGVAANQEKIAA